MPADRRAASRRLGRPAPTARTLARVGYVHENHAFPRYLTATALLEYYGALTPAARAGRQGAGCRVLLERVGLADRAREPIARFSKGMVQRLGVAQALLNDPELLVLDEPSEGLDLAGRRLLRDLVAEQRRRGRPCCWSRTSWRRWSSCATAWPCWSAAGWLTGARWRT